MRQQRAFSLVELLVVVGVISILVSLLLTALVGAKAKAERVRCLSNLRQLGLALTQFVGDNHTYPLYGNRDFPEHPAHSTSWVGALHKASGEPTTEKPREWLSKGIWKCPSAKPPSDWPLHEGYISYDYNAFGLGSPSDGSSLGLGGARADFRTGEYAPPVAESQVANPVQMVALGDGFTGWPRVIRDGVGTLWRSPSAEDRFASTSRSNRRHQRRATVFFCDGHAEALPLKRLFYDTDEAALKLWNRDNQPHLERLR
jgi:prepilin-type N-terminal cleavage/methylation domain-containing protein/prepilin-type processing-associated H-X9-DG protein